MTMIYDPFTGLEGELRDISLFYKCVEENGDPISLNRLKETVNKIRDRRKGMSKEELKASTEILSQRYFTEVASRQHFEDLYHFLQSVEERDDWDPSEEDAQDYITRRFRETRMEFNERAIKEIIERNISGLRSILGVNQYD